MMTSEERIELLAEQVEFLAKAVTELQEAEDEHWWINWRVKAETKLRKYSQAQRQWLREDFPTKVDNTELEA